MSWDDDTYCVEFAKFVPADQPDQLMYEGNLDVLYCEVLYNTLEDYTSQWNKQRKRVQVRVIARCEYTPRKSDYVDYNGIIYLDMGARLFRAIRSAKEKKFRYVKIIKHSNPRDKFDTHYFVSEYKLKEQKTLDTVKKPTKK